jgi:hypothetical protein
MNDDDDSGAAPASTPTLSQGLPARASAHRAPPIALPSDPAESAALVLRFVQTGTTAFDRSAAIEAMAVRLDRLRNADADVALAELAGHAAILDALFQRFTAASVQATAPDAVVKFAKLALAAQGAYTRTLIAIEGLKQQRKGKARVSVENDPDHDDDSD